MIVAGKTSLESGEEIFRPLFALLSRERHFLGVFLSSVSLFAFSCCRSVVRERVVRESHKSTACVKAVVKSASK